MSATGNSGFTTTVLDGLFGGLLALGGFLFNLYRRKVDRLESQMVARYQLQETMDYLKGDYTRMHAEQLSAMREIRDAVAAVHTRVDQILLHK